MAGEHEGEYASRWAALTSIADKSKIGKGGSAFPVNLALFPTR
jgi:hypothetical protein